DVFLAFLDRRGCRKVFLTDSHPKIDHLLRVETNVRLGHERFFTAAFAEREFEEMQRRHDKRIRVDCLPRYFRNLAFVEVINTLPVLRVVEIDVGNRTLDRRALGQKRFQIRVEMFDLLLCFERARQTYCSAISMAHDANVLLRSFVDDSFVHFGFEIRRDLDEIVALLLRLTNGGSRFGFCRYDVSVGGFASGELWTGSVDRRRNDLSSSALPA